MDIWNADLRSEYFSPNANNSHRELLLLPTSLHFLVHHLTCMDNQNAKRMSTPKHSRLNPKLRMLMHRPCKFQLQLYLRLDSQSLLFALLAHPHPKETFYHQYLRHFFPTLIRLVNALRTILRIDLHQPNQYK